MAASPLSPSRSISAKAGRIANGLLAALVLSVGLLAVFVLGTTGRREARSAGPSGVLAPKSTRPAVEAVLQGNHSPVASALGRPEEPPRDVGTLVVEVLDPAARSEPLSVLVHELRPDPKLRWKPWLLGEQELSLSGVRGEVSFELPVDLDLMVEVRGNGISADTRDRPVRLTVGRTTTVTVDLSSSCEVRGALVGLPGNANAGRVLDLVYPDWIEGRDGDLPSVGPGRLVVKTGEGGGFRFLGHPDRSFQLHLRTLYGTVVLEDVSTSARSWSSCRGAEILVTPSQALVGVLPTDPNPETITYSVAFDEDPMQPMERYPAGIALVPADRYSRASQLRFFAPRFGSVVKQTYVLPPDSTNLVHVPIDEVQAGGIRVRTREAFPPWLGVNLRISGEGVREVVPLQQAYLDQAENSGFALTRFRFEDGLKFVGVPPDTYDLYWTWDLQGERLLRRDVGVELGKETLVSCSLPDVDSYTVRIENWEAIPAHMRPRTLFLDRQFLRLEEGAVKASLCQPLPAGAAVMGPHNYLWSQLLPLRAGEPGTSELLLTYPFEELETFLLRLSTVLDGGRLVAHVEPGPLPDAPIPSIPPNWIQPGHDGFPELIYEKDHPPRGALMEYAYGARVLRGWFDAGTDREELSSAADQFFAGRFVDLVFLGPRNVYRVYVAPPDWHDPEPSPMLLGSVDSGYPNRLWVSFRSAVLLFEDPSGETLRVDVAPEDVSLRIHCH